MPPIRRRTALLLGGLGAAGVAAGGTGLWLSLASRQPPAGGTSFAQPPELRSSNGRLQVRLEAAPADVPLGGRTASGLAYNGVVPGPTLRLRPGDVLSLELVNNLAAPTNLHVHGLHVSPSGNADNVFLMVEPGASFSYEYRLPDHHPAGTFWYHPHRHGSVADQIFAGLFGAIIVEDPMPAAVSTERLMVVSDTTLTGTGAVAAASPMDRMLGREGQLVLVNGLRDPRLEARAGERERWRIVNTCVARYLRLRLDGQPMQLLGRDSRFHRAPLETPELILAPGNRADVLVTARAGDASLRTYFYDRGGMAGMRVPGPAGGPSDGGPGGPGIALATLSAAAGERAAAPPAVQARPEPADLRTAAVSARRQFVFTAGGPGPGMVRFSINGREFSASRTDTVAAAGTVEEWTLTNDSPMDHPFHLHVWPMQVIRDGTRTVDQQEWQDVVNVPARGEVTVRVAFEDYTGRTVYHCHILDHEDNGMMGVIEVR